VLSGRREQFVNFETYGKHDERREQASLTLAVRKEGNLTIWGRLFGLAFAGRPTCVATPAGHPSHPVIDVSVFVGGDPEILRQTAERGSRGANRGFLTLPI
jgi:hypothetical protein